MGSSGKLNFEKDFLIQQRNLLAQQVQQLQERVRELEAELSQKKVKTNARGKKPVKNPDNTSGR